MRASVCAHVMVLLSYADRWPSYPANVLPQLVSTAIVQDNRFGFWNHSNLTIAWHTPNSECAIIIC